MEKCRVLSGNNITDIDNILANLYDSYLYADGVETDEDFRSLSIKIKQEILNKYVHKRFREVYEYTDAAEPLFQFIRDKFYSPEDEYSELLIPTLEEIQAALSDDDTFQTSQITDKDDNSTSRIELDNEGRVIRKHLSDKFMTKAFGNAYETKKYVENFGVLGILSAAIIDRRNGRKISTLDDINRNIREFQEELFNNIVEYAKYTGETPKIESLYTDTEVTSGLQNLRGFTSQYLTPEQFTPQVLNRIYSEIQSGKSSKGNILAYNAYISLVLLNNFDSFIQNFFGKNIEINDKYIGRRTLENKYRLASKGTNMNQTWRTSSEIFVVDEIDGLTKALINTTPRYAYGSDTPLNNMFITYQQFLTQICKIKELMHSFKPDFRIDPTAVDRDGHKIYNLTLETQKFIKGKSFKEIIALTSSVDAEKAWIAIFEILSRNNLREELTASFSKDDLSIIQSIYKGIFDQNRQNSIANLMHKYPNIDKNYLEYIIQNATSVFPVKFIQYLKDGNDIYVRSLQDQAQAKARKNIETAINTKNSRYRIELEGEYDPNKYGIIEINKEKHWLSIDPLAQYKNDPVKKVLVGKYKATLILTGTQDILTNPRKFTQESYEELKDFFQDILDLNLDDSRFEQALFAQYLGVNGVDYDNLVSDLYDMSIRVLGNQWISNVFLKGQKTKSQIYHKLTNTSTGLFSKELMPRFNDSLEEISLFNSTTDYPKLEKLGAAWVMSRLNSSFIQVQDGEGNTSSTSTLSNLQSNYRVQWLTQIKGKIDAAARNFSIMDDMFVTLYRQKELHDQNSRETKQTTDFNLAEYVQSSLVQNFIDGLISYNKINKRVSNDTYPIKNGKVGILPSVNSDKPFIGTLVVNLNKPIFIDIDQSITWEEALLNPDYQNVFYDYIIQPELGEFYEIASTNIENTLRQVLQLAGVPQEIINATKVNDFTAINDWAQENNINLPKLLFETTNKYNNTPEGRINPIELIDQVHFVADKNLIRINESFLSQLYIHNNKELFNNFLKIKESQLLKDLLKNRVQIYTDSFSPEQFSQYRKLVGDENWERNGQLIFATFTINGEAYEIVSKRDLMQLQAKYDFGNVNIVENPDQLRNYGELTLNPLISKYNLLDYVITQEWNSSTVGAYYAHPSKAKIAKKSSFFIEDMHGSYPKTTEWDNASRTDASFKRNVANTAAEHIFVLNALNGIPDTYNISVIEDLIDTVYNITGDIDEVSPTDGGMFVNPFIVYLENNSLKGERVGINKKQFCHAYSAKTGTQIIIKTAGFGITNETMRMSKFDQALMRKMTKRAWISKTGQLLDINFLRNITYNNPNSTDLQYYFKKDGKYYILHLSECKKVGKNTYERVIQEVSKNGTPIDEAKPEIVTVESNYDLWEFFGGKDSMRLNIDKLEWSEASIEAVVTAMNNIAVNDAGVQIPIYKGCYQPLKHSDIHYACGAGAVKCGAANVNSRSAFDIDDENFDPDYPLNFMTIKVNQLGVQLDKEHQATGEELSLMTQVISSCISRGFTLNQAIEMYQGLAQLSRQETTNFSQVKDINSLEQVIVATILNQASKSALNNSTLENLLLPLLKKKEQGEVITLQDIQDAGIPYSDNSVYNKIISMCSVELTRKGIKAKVEGLLAVLCPSHNRIKIYGNRTLNAWDNEDSLPKDINDAPLTLEQEQRDTKYLIYSGISTDKLVEIEMGKTYRVRMVDGSERLFDVIIPRDYHKLKNMVRSGEVTGILEHILDGRNLGGFNCRFTDDQGRRWQLYDFKSSMDLFDLKHLIKLTPVDIQDILAGDEILPELLDAINKQIGGNFTQEELRQLVSNGLNILREYLKVPYSEQDLLRQEVLDLFKSKNLATLIRRQVQKDLNSVYKGGAINLYNGNTIVVNENSNKEIQAYEAVLPKKFAREFGLEVNDDLATIAENQDFFVERIIKNLTLNPIMNSNQQNWDIAFKNISGQHIYVISRNNLPNTTGLHLKENVYTYTDSSGNIIRTNSSYNEMYSLSSDKDVIYEDNYGNEVIVTDDLHYYMDNLQYTNIQISEHTAQVEGINYDSQFKDIIDYMSDSDNDVAKELYNYFVLPEVIDPITREVIPAEKLETLNVQNLIAINQDNNSAIKIKTSKLFRYIQKQGREIHTSFLRSLDIVAARIPAQSMQSFMPMKIVAFIESDVNTAYVSTDQIWLQGSDYDIDAVSLAMFAINRMGKYQKWSPYMNLDSIELLLESEKLPLPTGIETKVGIGGYFDFSKYEGTLFKVNKKSVQLIPSRVDLLVQFLQEINKFGPGFRIDWGKTKFQKELDKSLQDIINTHNLYLIKLKSKQAKDNAVKNYNMSRIYSIASNPVNLIEASQSVDNTTGEPKAIANTSSVALEQRTHTYGNFANKFLAIIENQVGKKCVGISANGLKAFFALTEYYDMILNDSSLSEEEKCKRLIFDKTIVTYDRKDGSLKQWRKQMLANVIKHTETASPKLAEALASIDQDTDAAIILSAILSLATDNAKELSLAKLNAGVNMLGIYVYGVMLGIDFEGLSNIMMSAPALIVRDLMEGNSFGSNLKMYKLDQVFDYIELGPKKQLQALNDQLVKAGSRDTTVLSVISVVEEAIRNKFKDWTQENDIFDQPSFDNYLAKLAKGHPNDLLEKLDRLEQIKAGLYKKYAGYSGAWAITRMIDFIQDYMIQIGQVLESKQSQDNYQSLKTLAFGAMEIRTLGQELALNQGLPSSPSELISKISQIEQVINKIAKQNRNNQKRKAFFETGKFKRMRKLKDASFSLVEFVKNSQYRAKVIEEYGANKDTFNILDVLATNPQYFEYLSRLVNAYEIADLPVKTRALRRGTQLAVEEQQAYDLKDIQDISKQVEGLINRYLINAWLAESPYGQFKLPAGQYLYTRDYKGRIKRKENKLTSPKIIQLNTQDGRDTFIMYMETYVIPRIKSGKDKSGRKYRPFQENKFIQALKPLTFNQLNPDRSPRIGYSLPINMMPRTPDENHELEVLKESFYKLTGNDFNFGEHNLFNLFYLYNLLAFENRRSETTLASLFDQNTQDIDISKRKFINSFDKTRDILIEDGKMVMKSQASITKNQLIEATRLIRSPWSTELKHIYAPDKLEFGYSPYDKKEEVQFTQEQIESGAADAYYEQMEQSFDEYVGPNTDKGNYQKITINFDKDQDQRISFDGITITHHKGKIVEIRDNGKKLTIPGYEWLITKQQIEGGMKIAILDKQSNKDIINNYKNGCKK